MGPHSGTPYSQHNKSGGWPLPEALLPSSAGDPPCANHPCQRCLTSLYGVDAPAMLLAFVPVALILLPTAKHIDAVALATCTGTSIQAGVQMQAGCNNVDVLLRCLQCIEHIPRLEPGH